MVQPQLVKIGGPWTRSMIRGSMDPVHERGSMDPVHILMDPVHGPGPRRGSMDQGSMFCTFPSLLDAWDELSSSKRSFFAEGVSSFFELGSSLGFRERFPRVTDLLSDRNLVLGISKRKSSKKASKNSLQGERKLKIFSHFRNFAELHACCKLGSSLLTVYKEVPGVSVTTKSGLGLWGCVLTLKIDKKQRVC